MTTNQPTTPGVRRLDTEVDPEHLWGRYWAGVENEAWQAARQLLDLSPRVRSFYFRHLETVPVLRYDDDDNVLADLGDDLALDWQAAADDIATDGFPSTEGRLARLVAALTTGEPFPLDDLAWMNSWSTDVLTVLVRWASDDRDTVAPARGRGHGRGR